MVEYSRGHPGEQETRFNWQCIIPHTQNAPLWSFFSLFLFHCRQSRLLLPIMAKFPVFPALSTSSVLIVRAWCWVVKLAADYVSETPLGLLDTWHHGVKLQKWINGCYVTRMMLLKWKNTVKERQFFIPLALCYSYCKKVTKYLIGLKERKSFFWYAWQSEKRINIIALKKFLIALNNSHKGIMQSRRSTLYTKLHIIKGTMQWSIHH